MAAARRDQGRSSKKVPAGIFAGKWVIERVLGQGGMGVVYAASHARLGHRVALKVLGEELRDHPELVARFEREARATCALSSPHAVKVHDIDVTKDRTPFIVMELLEGCDLGRILDRAGPQPVGRAVRWILEACDAIAEAHRLGIVHRDIKPSNLFLAQVEGRTLVKVLDFGIAKRFEASARDPGLTGDVAPLGTPHYMSPEQVRCAKEVDPRTDIWSLGVTLFELLTGETPYMQESPSACIAAIAADPVRDPRVLRPDLPAPLVDVLMCALRKDPAERWGSVEDLAAALTPFAEGASDDVTPEASVVRLGTGAAKKRLLLESTTLGDGDVAIAVPRHALDIDPDLGALAPPPASDPSFQPFGPDYLPGAGRRPYRSDLSVPPAISRASTGNRRKGTRLVAFAAGLLALGGLAALPKCTPLMASANSTVGVAPSQTSVTVLTKGTVAAEEPARDESASTPQEDLAAAPIVAAEPPRAQAASTTANDKPAPASTTQARAAVRPQANERSTAKKPKGIADEILPNTAPSRPRAAVAATAVAPEVETPVHGGLRGPGF